MHYWPAEVTGLSECHLPFFDFTERLISSGRETAQQVFGCRGATAGHTTDVWHWTAIIGRLEWGLWPHGLGWNALHFMEHYRYTGDEDFLRHRAYPVLRDVSLFYLDYLTPHPITGQLVAGPDNSPENRYRGSDGQNYAVSMGPSMSQEIIWEVFSSTLAAAEILRIEDSLVDEIRLARENYSDQKSAATVDSWNGPSRSPNRNPATATFPICSGSILASNTIAATRRR